MPKNFLRFYWKTILFCILIFVLSSVTFKSLPDAAKFQNSDKLTHAIMYVVLGFIVFFEFQKDTFFKAKYKYWLAGIFLFLVIFGGLIEIAQGTFFKPRTSEFADWIADIVGLTVGYAIGKLTVKTKKQSCK